MQNYFELFDLVINESSMDENQSGESNNIRGLTNPY